ncbi:MAG: hypothetical protein ABI651_20255 [Verrucomicrobiota bacterium]
MDNEAERRLAERIHTELRRLPPLKAPETLAARVLATIESRAHQPWWRKSWMNWPSSVRLAFVVGVCALATGFLYLGFQFGSDNPAGTAITKVSEWFGFLEPLWNLIAALGNAFVLVLRAGGQLLFWGTAAFVAAMYLTCVGLGTLCYRVALNKI